MYRVTREIRFCYGHRLLHYDGKCKHLHGHNGRAVISLLRNSGKSVVSVSSKGIPTAFLTVG